MSYGRERVYSNRRQKCSFAGCEKTKQQYPHLQFFSFPTTRPSVCNEWVSSCANSLLIDLPESTLKAKVVCADHFTKDCFNSFFTKTRLNKNAVPTIPTVIKGSCDHPNRKLQNGKVEQYNNLNTKSEEGLTPNSEMLEVLIKEVHVSEDKDCFTDEDHSQISQGTSLTEENSTKSDEFHVQEHNKNKATSSQGIKSGLIDNTMLSKNTPDFSTIQNKSLTDITYKMSYGRERVYSNRRQKCSFAGCKKTKEQHPHLHCFPFPTTRPSVCNKWVANCANSLLIDLPGSTLKAKVVCEEHFTEDCFNSLKKTRLNKNAVPTIRTAIKDSCDQLSLKLQHVKSEQYNNLKSDSEEGLTPNSEMLEVLIKEEHVSEGEDCFNKKDDSQMSQGTGITEENSTQSDEFHVQEHNLNEMNCSQGIRNEFFYNTMLSSNTADCTDIEGGLFSDITYYTSYGQEVVSSNRRHKCSFSGCEKTKQQYPHLRFYSFPVTRLSVCSQWVANCANSLLLDLPLISLKAKVVCEEHFTENCFSSFMKNRLNSNAVPTIQTVIKNRPDQASEKLQNDKKEQYNLWSESEEELTNVSEMSEEHVYKGKDCFNKGNHTDSSKSDEFHVQQYSSKSGKSSQGIITNDLKDNTRSSNTPDSPAVLDNSNSDTTNKMSSGKEVIPSKRRQKCSFAGCKKTKQQYPHLHFFQFPTSRPSVCKEWVASCANSLLIDLPESTLKAKVVCEKHFTEDCFSGVMKNRLNPDAVPTIQTKIKDTCDQCSGKFQNENGDHHNLNSDSEEGLGLHSEMLFEDLLQEDHVSEGGGLLY